MEPHDSEVKSQEVGSGILESGSAIPAHGLRAAQGASLLRRRRSLKIGPFRRVQATAWPHPGATTPVPTAQKDRHFEAPCSCPAVAVLSQAGLSCCILILTPAASCHHNCNCRAVGGGRCPIGAAAALAAVTESERQRRRRPLQKSGGRLRKRPLQKAGGGRDGRPAKTTAVRAKVLKPSPGEAKCHLPKIIAPWAGARAQKMLKPSQA